MSEPAPPRLFDPRRHGPIAALLALTMIAAAATESFGLMLLVPMLAVLQGGPQAGAIGEMAGLLAGLGVPLALGPLLVLFVILAFLRALIVHARAMVGQRFEAELVDALRARAWAALLGCEWRKLATMDQARSASLLISNTDRVGAGLNQGISALASLVTLTGVALAGIAIAPLPALAGAAGGLAILFVWRRLRRRAGVLGEQLNQAYHSIYVAVQEGLGALRVIKSFGHEAPTVASFVRRFAELREAERGFLRASGYGQIALQGGGALLLAGIVWLAIDRWGADTVTVLPLVALFARALPLLNAIQISGQHWAHARPAMVATLALIAEAERAAEPVAEGLNSPRLSRSIVLEAVQVRFPGRGEAALSEVSLTIPAGSITVLAGPSGAGKSTLADLVGGLLAADAGQVRIDDCLLEGALRRAWRSRVAYVQQDPVLFAGTIRCNLAWADPTADEAAMRRVLADAAAQFVFELPRGLDTPVGDAGRQLSGGERQRIVLARALLRDPDLLILDEATSALDPGNETAIAAALTALRGRLTVLVIGHKGALQSIADHIVRLEAGRVVAV